MRLIDADEFKKQLENAYEYTELAEMIEMLDNAPTVEYTFEEAFQKTVCEQKLYCPTVCGNNPKWCESCVSKGKCASTRPQGKWVIQRLQNSFDDVYCPFCNARPTRSEYGYYLKDNFCHECGADMRGSVK